MDRPLEDRGLRAIFHGVDVGLGTVGARVAGHLHR
jgi:hypothetical protein